MRRVGEQEERESRRVRVSRRARGEWVKRREVIRFFYLVLFVVDIIWNTRRNSLVLVLDWDGVK